ncbi:unnamed protein product [Rotaria sp. Silwood1]|nr:unnamed protein product [Rotaria sp. Silwood1]
MHHALGGGFGPSYKVAFGYDFVGDRFNQQNPVPEEDNDPLDNCSSDAHGTHVAGIIAANATQLNTTGFIPIEPFLGVAPEVTLGAFTMSVGGAGAYTESPHSIAAQRVSEQGVYLTFSFGNEGSQGLQTGGSPSISSGAMAIASVDNSHSPRFYLLTPDGERIYYLPGTVFGGWQSNVPSRIVVNNPQATVNDGCSGPDKNVTGAVVLYAFNNADGCNSAVRCNRAAQAGATGCLIYNAGAITGSSTIPSGSITMDDGLKIIVIVANDSSSIFTFTNLQGIAPVVRRLNS